MGEREISHCWDLHPTSCQQLVRLHRIRAEKTLLSAANFDFSTPPIGYHIYKCLDYCPDGSKLNPHGGYSI